jgi:hypothetical protein
MTFGIKIKTNKRLANEALAFDKYAYGTGAVFPYTERPSHFIREIQEGQRYDNAFIGYKVLPRMFSISFWGRCRIAINFWPLFTILIKI